MWQRIKNRIGGERDYFICPRCNEEIYETDWMNEDYFHGYASYEHRELQDAICPICMKYIFKGEC